MFEKEKILQHIVDKIETSTLVTDPYPYINIENFFPNDFYNAILENIPKNKIYDSWGYRPLSKKYSNRFVYDLLSGENNEKQENLYENLTLQQKEFWSFFKEVMVKDNTVKNSFLKKYENYIDCPILDYGFMNARISKDIKGYYIGSHRDRRDKIFSAVMYFATGDEDPKTKEDWGTAVLKPIDLKIEHNDDHRSFDEFEIVDLAQYTPNRMFSWAVSQNSYHGVTPTTVDGERNTLAYFLKIPKNLSNFHTLYGEDNFKPNGEK